MHATLLGVTLRKIALGSGIALGLAACSPVFAASASAQTADTASSATYQVNLTQMNNAGVSGTATLNVSNNDVTVTIRATGLSPNRAHASHIYVGGQAECPSPSADANKDGFVDNNEAKASRGELRVSLTTSGDTGPNSALAFNRMPVADKDGKVTYSRTFAIPAGIQASDLKNATIGMQGIATLYDSKTIYDGSKRSELTNDHAFETTVPVACGKISTPPVGGTDTGAGATSGIESPTLLVIGTASLVGAVAVGLFARKQLSN